MKLEQMYQEVILDHYRRPRGKGALDAPAGAEVLAAERRNPLCGDEVTVYAAFEDGHVSDVRFTGRGCSISQASASMMTERLMGKSREEAESEIAAFKSRMKGEGEFDETEELAALGGVVKYPSRIRCATLAWDAFSEGLQESG